MVYPRFSIIDYRWNEEFQLDCPITYKTIENNSTTTLGIEYDLLPLIQILLIQHIQPIKLLDVQ